MTTENQTQPTTDPASQAQRDREMLARLTTANHYPNGLHETLKALSPNDAARLVGLATRALDLEASLPDLLDKAKREASHAVLCGMVERLGLDGMQKDDKESLESVLFRYAEEHERLKESDKAGGKTIRRLEIELERMNAVVAGMEADAELGRLVRRMPRCLALEKWDRGWTPVSRVSSELRLRCEGEFFDTPEAALRAALGEEEP